MSTELLWMQRLNEVTVELTSILELDRLLERAAHSIRRFIDYDLFAILLIDDDRNGLACKLAVGFSRESLSDLQKLKAYEGPVGRAVRTRSYVLVENVEAEPDVKAIRTASGRTPRSQLALPLVVKDAVMGVLVMWSVQPAFFREEHLHLLNPLAAQIAVSIENASLYEEKSRSALTRQVLYEVGKDMTSILEFDELLGRMAVLIGRVIEYEILGIFLYNPDLDVMELKVDIGYAAETVQRWRTLPMGKGLLGHAVLARKTLVSTDLANDPRAISAKTADGRWTQSEVAIPLISRHRLLGGVVVESCDPYYFKPERVELLDTLARQMAVAIDNARLFEQLLAKEQRLEADFALARDLQASMLPAVLPLIPGFQASSVYKPAESLGGDYYDLLPLDENRLGLAVGDVSGKGVAAAMTMAAARSALRFAARIHSAPSQVLYHINRRLFRDVKKRAYVSLFYGVLDLPGRIFRWSNGGHLPPILMRADGSTDELVRGGVPIALFDRSRYDSGRVKIEPGDVLFFYTDGLTEAVDRLGEEFGKERLLAALRKSRDQSPREILRAVQNEVKKFSRGGAQQDDMTVVILKADG